MERQPFTRLTSVRRSHKMAVLGALFGLAALPALWLALQWALLLNGQPHGLGFNPQEYTNRYTGIWTFRLLIAALAISPLAQISGQRALIGLRRMVGLFAFAYACLHLTSYLGLDLLFDWAAFLRDIAKRTYILLGVAAFSCLLPLALTSTNGWIRRLGARRWQRLHRLVYAAGILASLHFIMLAKGNQLEPKVHAGLIALLLGWRIHRALRTRKATARAGPY